jgi:5-formyltetrahydrofolate cyclo-ligase
METKAALRQTVRARLSLLTPAHRAAASAQTCLFLEKQSVWPQAKSVLCYAPMPGELDIWRLVGTALAAGKTVCLPRFDSKTKQYAAALIQDPARDIEIGRFNIREPAGHCASIGLERLDLVLVPGIAFDLAGRRLGRGKGFYDRLLVQVRGKTCGVAFDEQIVAKVPVEPHDARVNLVLTPTRCVDAD